MDKNKVVEIIEFSDPVCTWCWGSEPVLRKLETRYGSQLQVKFVMGGLVRNIEEFYDSSNDIGGDANKSNQQIVSHWLQASLRHKMPVEKDGFSLFSKEHPSTYPQNIAYKAAQMESEKLANKFLRNIREATAVQARQTNKTGVLIEIASETGLDIAKFIERFSDGSAEAAFMEDLKIMHSYNVKGFPSFLVKYGDEKILMQGYQGYEAIKSVIDSLTNDSIKQNIIEKTDDEVLNFIKKYERVAPIEIQSTFDLSDIELEQIIGDLIDENLVEIIPAGNGIMIGILSNALYCDSDSAFCGF